MHERRLLELEYWTPNEDRFSQRVVEPYALINGREGWYVAAVRSRRKATACATSGWTASSARELLDERFERARGPRPGRRHRRLAAHRHGRRLARRARAGSPPSRRAGRARSAPSLAELAGRRRSIVEWAFKGIDFLVREVLKEAGDAVVLEPADAREAVLAAAERPARAEPA